jgi:hypothetical protein
MGLEPTTSTLGRLHSTTELRPLQFIGRSLSRTRAFPRFPAGHPLPVAITTIIKRILFQKDPFVK